MRAAALITIVLTSLAAALTGAESESRPEALAKRQSLIRAETLRTDDRIALLEKMAKADPDPVIKVALSKAFMQKVRETGDGAYLSRASKVVDAVLAVQPGFVQAKRLRNEIEMNLHHFPAVIDYAETMLAEDPADPATLGLLGDAYMELGKVERASDAYTRMISRGANLFSYNRLAYYNFVTGKADAAMGWMAQAVAAGSKAPENRAWCLSEMGDMLFKTGRTADAEIAYRLALDAFPGYHRAHAGLGRLQAANQNWTEAAQNLKRAQAVVPLPEYAAALEIVFEQMGDRPNALRQRALIDAVEKLNTANGEKANRTLALIYADSGRNLPRALELAKAEFEVRNDVYSYDALSWVLLKSGDVAEARKASEKAIALGTPEPSFFYHAGMIAAQAGDAAQARVYLQKALRLNPRFDVRNAVLARNALNAMDKETAALAAH